jgi:hypothetical protein
MTTILLPDDHLSGTPGERRQLRALLAGLRASPGPAALPGITFAALPEVLASGLADQSLFAAGYEHLSRRYASLGMRAMLPLSRVWAGIKSSAPAGDPAGYGGFHHPGQGYRHLQAAATLTAYGDLTAPHRPSSPQSVALDLLRSYAHDCLHYGTCRRYRLTPDGQAARVQYGINFRAIDGRTYSAPDPPGTAVTRNLGIVMEGATDTEATTIARITAADAGISTMDGPPGIARYAWQDTTGTLTSGAPSMTSPDPYLRALSGFHHAITRPYQHFTAALSALPGERGELHHLVVTAMVSGSLTALEAWLDARNGPRTFVSYFLSPAWDPLHPAGVDALSGTR